VRQFLLILSQPDNLPIAGMVVLVVVVLGVWLRQALQHDRLIAQGRKDEIGRKMRQ